MSLLTFACPSGAGHKAKVEKKAEARETTKAAASSPPEPSIELVLERALPIETAGEFEASGLLLHDGHLLTVSDRHDDSVWEIILAAGTASLKRYLRFDAGKEEPRPFDFEGLSHEPGGALLLASEGRYRVLRVAPNGDTSWVTPPLAEPGRKAGLFLKKNAGIEGVTQLADGRLLLAAEREQRGLIEMPRGGTESDAVAWPMPLTRFPAAADRSPDFADLTVFDGAVYALMRNMHLVVKLERSRSGWLERQAWSYATTENDPRYLYEDRRYGLGEGLAIDENRVYVVLDNNRRRRAAIEDTRPLLFVFRRPR